MLANMLLRSKLNDLIELASQLYPVLQGRLESFNGDGVRAGKNNQAELKRLVAHLQQYFPEAGAPYWSVRSWSLLMWQPIALAVISVHCFNIRLPLTAINQDEKQGVISGYSLTDTVYHSGEVPALIEQTAQELRLLCQLFFTDLNHVIALRQTLARRLVADILLHTLNFVSNQYLNLSNQQIEQIGKLWLSHMGLVGESHFISIALSNSSERLFLNRKSCCFDYRRVGGLVCASCPKHKLNIRIQLMREEYENRF